VCRPESFNPSGMLYGRKEGAIIYRGRVIFNDITFETLTKCLLLQEHEG